MEHQTLINANEASLLCRLSKATIYKLVQQGRLRGFRVLNRTLRFDPDDITALVRQLPIDPTATGGRSVRNATGAVIDTDASRCRRRLPVGGR